MVLLLSLIGLRYRIRLRESASGSRLITILRRNLKLGFLRQDSSQYATFLFLDFHLDFRSGRILKHVWLVNVTEIKHLAGVKK